MLSEICDFLNETISKQDQWLQLIEPYRQTLGDVVIEDFKELLNSYENHNNANCSTILLGTNLIDLAWEQMHTGHWKNVSLGWRILYSSVKLMKVIHSIQLSCEPNESNPSVSELILLIHELDYSLIMGYPILDGLACKLASKLHCVVEKLQPDFLVSVSDRKLSHAWSMEDFPPPKQPLHILNRMDAPSLEKFSELMLDGRPFIISNAMQFWPACQCANQSQWTIDYWIRKFGLRLVPIETGSKYTEESWGQEFMPLYKFVKQFVLADDMDGDRNGNTETKGYLAQHQLFLQIPELMDDLFVPDYCFVHGCSDDETKVDSNIWFGPQGTVSPLHHDSERANLLTQIKGYKYLILYPASETEFLHAFPDHMLHNTSEIDAENPDLTKYPELLKANGFHGIIGPGEMIYIPPRCWHYVRSLSISISVNFWWDVISPLIPPWPTSYAMN